MSEFFKFFWNLYRKKSREFFIVDREIISWSVDDHIYTSRTALMALPTFDLQDLLKGMSLGGSSSNGETFDYFFLVIVFTMAVYLWETYLGTSMWNFWVMTVWYFVVLSLCT